MFHSSTGDRTMAMKKKGGAKKSAKKKGGAKKKAAKKKSLAGMSTEKPAAWPASLFLLSRNHRR